VNFAAGIMPLEITSLFYFSVSYSQSTDMEAVSVVTRDTSIVW
jgi:hypothetical protein